MQQKSLLLSAAISAGSHGRSRMMSQCQSGGCLSQCRVERNLTERGRLRSAASVVSIETECQGSPRPGMNARPTSQRRLKPAVGQREGSVQGERASGRGTAEKRKPSLLIISYLNCLRPIPSFFATRPCNKGSASSCSHSSNWSAVS